MAVYQGEIEVPTSKVRPPTGVSPEEEAEEKRLLDALTRGEHVGSDGKLPPPPPSEAGSQSTSPTPPPSESAPPAATTPADPAKTATTEAPKDAAATPPAPPAAAATAPTTTPQAETQPPASEPEKGKDEGPQLFRVVIDGEEQYVTSEQLVKAYQIARNHQKLHDDLREARRIAQAIDDVTKAGGVEARNRLLAEVADHTDRFRKSLNLSGQQSTTTSGTTGEQPAAQFALENLPPEIQETVKWARDRQIQEKKDAERSALQKFAEHQFGQLRDTAEAIGVTLTEQDMGRVAQECLKIRAQALALPDGHPDRQRLYVLSLNPESVWMSQNRTTIKQARAKLVGDTEKRVVAEVAKGTVVPPAGAPPSAPPAAPVKTIPRLEDMTDADIMRLSQEDLDAALGDYGRRRASGS